ncbi:MAG: hypothetical protein IPK26_26945 [Planctomycetes bacterium]|nr:hypothetical protein [Planctomycetota bacterium]
MGFINVAERTINAKLVYFGVGVGGKTTSLQQVHGILCPRNEVQLVSINTEEDQTLLFDFLPINLGDVGGFKIKIQGFTVPGQPKYKQMRKYVLSGADAVVFVVDSQRSRLQENLDSLQNMRENLRASGAEDIPIVLQYNKRDLPDILPESELARHFRFRPDIETFPSVATEGQGVFEAFVHAAGLLVESKVQMYRLGRGAATAREVADSARRKLWEICDQVRRDRSGVALPDLPVTRVSLGAGDRPKPAVVVAEPAPITAPALPELSTSPGGGKTGDDFDLQYRVHDGTPTATGSREVLTDADLDIRLGTEVIDFTAEAEAKVDDHDSTLLDQTVRSNLELAQRFGDLDERRSLLERKVQELVEVAQNTVHDLAKPVSAIKLMLSTMAKGYLGKLAEPQQQAIENGQQAVVLMERLMRDLIDSSRLDHDGVRLQFREVDMTLLLADVLRTLRYEIEQKDVHVRLEPMPVIAADAWGLTKAFLNLVGNAIQYADPARQPVISIRVEDQGAEWRFLVQDNGIGIPTNDRERLFRRFERGSNTGGISGTGLGLHIVREIAQGHGGQVTFESLEGQGTTFAVVLPKAPVQAAHCPLTSASAARDR